MGQHEIPIQTISESQSSSFSLWFERREFRRGFGGIREGLCLSTEKASKQMNTVFSSEERLDYEIKKRKAQKQDSIRMPTLAVSAEMGPERPAVCPYGQQQP